MNTEWHERQEMEQRVMDGGALTEEESLRLLQDANEADAQEQTADGLGRVLGELGYQVVDVTTDDSEGRELHVVEAD